MGGEEGAGREGFEYDRRLSGGWVMSLPLGDASQAVIREIESGRRPASEVVKLDGALGRVLAEDLVADRDQPPFDRVTRDGFAVRAEDVRTAEPEGPITLEVALAELTDDMDRGREDLSICIAHQLEPVDRVGTRLLDAGDGKRDARERPGLARGGGDFIGEPVREKVL